MEILAVIIGFAYIYAFTHFITIQSEGGYFERSSYEKFITWFFFIMTLILIIGGN